MYHCDKLFLSSDKYMFVYSTGITFIEQNGWILLGAGVLFCYLWVKMQPYIKKWRKQCDERRYAAFCHKSM
jgi:hypothetical protein